MGLGLALRGFSLPLCVVAGVACAAWTLIHAGTGRDRGFPNLIPFHAGARTGLATWILSAFVALVALFVAVRLLAIAIGAMGWLLLPPEHRDMLSHLSNPARSGTRDDPPTAGDNVQQMRVAFATGDSELAVPRLRAAQGCRRGRPWSPER